MAGARIARFGRTAAPALLCLAAACAAHRHAPPSVAPGRVLIGYIFPAHSVLDPAAIDASRLTHVNYAFANIAGGRVVQGFENDARNLRALGGLRRRHPHLKVLVAIGGWTWSGGFSDAALTGASRRRFVESAVDFVRAHDLDGIDVDWEYPGLPGNGNTHRPEDRENFTALMAELRAALDTAGAQGRRRYLLTIAAGASREYLAHTEMGKVQASLDFVNLMAYDFRVESSSALAGHHANLYPHPADPDQVSADGAVGEFLDAGVPAAKLVLGVPFYGRAWGQVERDDAGGALYRPGRPLARRLDTRYANLAALVAAGLFERRWDERAQAPWLWNAETKTFVSYDDPESLRVKARYIAARGLAGAMFWEYNADPDGRLLAALSGELEIRR